MYFTCVHDEVGQCENIDVPGFCNFICQSEGMGLYLSFCDDPSDQLFTLQCVCTCPNCI